MALATTAVAALLFVGWVSFLLHVTRDPEVSAPRTIPHTPAAIPDVSDAARPAALSSFQ